ncbi:MAG: DUF5719 family protein [Vicinamibacteraceae bacterium]
MSAPCFRRQLLRALSFASLTVLACSGTLSAQTLMWNANTESNLAGYIVQYGPQSGSPSTTVDVGNVTSRTMTGLTPGTTYYFRVVAYNSTGQQSIPSAQVSYLVPATPAGPTVTSVSPTSGPTAGGTVITITGTNFATGATVRVGGTLASGITLLSSTQLRATTPAGSAGAQAVQVTNTSGASATLAGAFTYTAPASSPTVTSVSPTSGPTAGGTLITVNGTNFATGATVRVGGVLATGITLVSSTQLRATTPAGAAGAQPVQVTNTSGASATLNGAFTYTAPVSNPTVTSVSPTSGPTAGGTSITINGTNFAAGATVRVGGTLASGVTLVSSTQLRATTPAGTAGAQAVQVTNASGASGTLNGAFTYTAPVGAPTLTAVSPTSGPTAGGTTIALTGTNFVSGATVRVGGTVATNVTFVSATQVTARTPAGTAGARDVQITNPNGQAATRTGAFTYTAASSGPRPTFSLIAPWTGPTSGGTVVTLAGSNFVAGATVRIGGALATNVVVQSGSRIQATTPAGTVGARDVQITNPDGQFIMQPGCFSYTQSSSLTQTTAAATTFTSYLAEGVQSEQMNTQLAIANPQMTDAQATLTFQTTTGEQTQLAVDVPARSRLTVDAASVPALAGESFSTKLESNQELALDRLISLNADGASASLETAVTQPSTSWFFAEGSTIDPQELFYLVQNPGSTPANVRVRYLLPNGHAPVERTYSVAAGSRATIWVDREDPALAMTDVAAEITSVDGTPIVVERSLYLREAGSTAPRGGDSSTGVTAPATRWFVEGATGAYAMRLLLANPGAEAAQVQVAFRRADGRTVNRSYTVAASSRESVDVATVHPSLANTTLGITVQSSAPIVVERTKWWGANGRLDESVSGAGSTAGGARWLLAEGQQGGERRAQTSVVVFNQGAATDVTVTLLFEDGPEQAATFPVAAGARFAVPMAEAFPAAEGRKFSVLIEGADATANLVVDRAIFWQAPGSARTAGADGAASRLR